jgi:hypothetical protein
VGGSPGQTPAIVKKKKLSNKKDEIGSITTTEPIAQLVMMWNLIIALLRLG